MFLCIDSFIDSLIVGKVSIFMFIVLLCSYVLIYALFHSLQIKQWEIWGTDTNLLSNNVKPVMKPGDFGTS